MKYLMLALALTLAGCGDGYEQQYRGTFTRGDGAIHNKWRDFGAIPPRQWPPCTGHGPADFARVYPVTGNRGDRSIKVWCRDGTFTQSNLHNGDTP